jgi:hypothetical protein
MKKINNSWYDENNNSWNADVETEESAQVKSNTLINCSGCSDCRGCSEIKTNPQRYTTPKIGSRNSQTSIYWTNKDDIQIICGCWIGNIKDFEKRVKEVHAKTKHLKPYLAQIKIFKMLVKTLNQ